MMRWDEINPALVSLFTSLAVDQPAPTPPAQTPDWQAAWGERRREFVHPGQRQELLLKVTSCVSVGEDESRTDYDDEAEDVFETITGNRRFVLQVQARVLEHEDDLWAMQTLERLRTRLQWRSSLDALLAVNVALVEVRQAIKASATYDKRVWSIANMDVVLASSVNDANPIPVGWIEHVNLEAKIRGVDGEVLATPPNNAPGEWIPPLPDP